MSLSFSLAEGCVYFREQLEDLMLSQLLQNKEWREFFNSIVKRGGESEDNFVGTNANRQQQEENKSHGKPILYVRDKHVNKWIKQIDQRHIDFLEMISDCDINAIKGGLPVDERFCQILLNWIILLNTLKNYSQKCIIFHNKELMVILKILDL